MAEKQEPGKNYGELLQAYRDKINDLSNQTNAGEADKKAKALAAEIQKDKDLDDQEKTNLLESTAATLEATLQTISEKLKIEKAEKEAEKKAATIKKNQEAVFKKIDALGEEAKALALKTKALLEEIRGLDVEKYGNIARSIRVKKLNYFFKRVINSLKQLGIKTDFSKLARPKPNPKKGNEYLKNREAKIAKKAAIIIEGQKMNKGGGSVLAQTGDD